MTRREKGAPAVAELDDAGAAAWGSDEHDEGAPRGRLPRRPVEDVDDDPLEDAGARLQVAELDAMWAGGKQSAGAPLATNQSLSDAELEDLARGSDGESADAGQRFSRRPSPLWTPPAWTFEEEAELVSQVRAKGPGCAAWNQLFAVLYHVAERVRQCDGRKADELDADDLIAALAKLVAEWPWRRGQSFYDRAQPHVRKWRRYKALERSREERKDQKDARLHAPLAEATHEGPGDGGVGDRLAYLRSPDARRELTPKQADWLDAFLRRADDHDDDGAPGGFFDAEIAAELGVERRAVTYLRERAIATMRATLAA